MPLSSGKRLRSDSGGPRKAAKPRSSSRSRGTDEEETVMWSQDSPIREKAKFSQIPMRDSIRGTSSSNSAAALFERGKKSGSRRRKVKDEENEESAADVLDLLDSVEINTQGVTEKGQNGANEGSQSTRGGQGGKNSENSMPPPSLPSRISQELSQYNVQNSNTQSSQAISARISGDVAHVEVVSAGNKVSKLTQEQQLRVEEKRRAALARQAEQKRKLAGKPQQNGPAPRVSRAQQADASPESSPPQLSPDTRAFLLAAEEAEAAHKKSIAMNKGPAAVQASNTGGEREKSEAGHLACAVVDLSQGENLNDNQANRAAVTTAATAAAVSLSTNDVAKMAVDAIPSAVDITGAMQKQEVQIRASLAQLEGMSSPNSRRARDRQLPLQQAPRPSPGTERLISQAAGDGSSWSQGDGRGMEKDEEPQPSPGMLALLESSQVWDSPEGGMEVAREGGDCDDLACLAALDAAEAVNEQNQGAFKSSNGKECSNNNIVTEKDDSDTIKVLRLVCLDSYVDNKSSTKTIYCFPASPSEAAVVTERPQGGDSSSSSSSSGSVKESDPTGLPTTVAAGVCEVLLMGDWAHNCDVRPGEIFHVVDFCEIDLESLEAGGIGSSHHRSGPELARPSCIHFDVHDPSYVASAKANPVAVVNNTNGLIILNPDTLVSPTAISEAVTCQRRTVLSSRVKLSETAVAATLGNFYHEFFERILRECFDRLLSQDPHRRTPPVPARDGIQAGGGPGKGVTMCRPELLESIVEQVVSSKLEDLTEIGKTDQEARGLLMAQVLPSLQWAAQAYYAGFDIGAATSTNGRSHKNRGLRSCPNGSRMRVDAIDSSEEQLWSPVLGLKGYVDLTAKLSYSSPSSSGAPPVLCPVEIKTGKPSAFNEVEHKAQVTIYILMMILRGRCRVHRWFSLRNEPQSTAEQQETPCSVSYASFGLLLYINAHHVDRETECRVIAPDWVTMRSLLVTRNNLAAHLNKAEAAEGAAAIAAQGSDNTYSGIDGTSARDEVLPPLLRDARTCENCFRSAECMTHAAAREGVTALTSGTPTLFTYSTSHLSTAALDYLRHWDALLDIEAAATSVSRHTTWSESSSARVRVNKRTEGGLQMQVVLQPDDLAKEDSIESAVDATGGVQEEGNEVGENERHPVYRALRAGMTVLVLRRSYHHVTHGNGRECKKGPALAGRAAARLTNPSLLHVGDKVILSLEAATSLSASSATTTPSTVATSVNPGGAADIEDAVAPVEQQQQRRRMPWSVVDIEPGVAGGGSNAAVLAVEESHLIVAVRHVPPRLLRMVKRYTSPSMAAGALTSLCNASNEEIVQVCGSVATGSVCADDDDDVPPSSLVAKSGRRGMLGDRNIYIRLDRDESTVIGTNQARSNLYTLLLNPHDRNAYKAYKQHEESGRSTDAVGNSSQQFESSEHISYEGIRSRLRSLVIDMASPRFAGVFAEKDGPGLFRPRALQADVWVSIVTALQAFDRGGVNPALDKRRYPPTPQAAASIISARKAAAAAAAAAAANGGSADPPPPLNAPFKVVEEGSNGELHVLGGKYVVYPGCSPLKLYREYCRLNMGQKRAVKKILVSQDYTLLLGLPGTGKTSTLSVVIRALVARGERVLLTSYTHSAVDTVMIKLAEAGVLPSISIRLGSAASSVHASIQPFMLDLDGSDAVKAATRVNAQAVLSAAGGANGSANSDNKSQPRTASAGSGTSIATPAPAAAKTNQGNLAALHRRCAAARIVATTVLTAPRSKVIKLMSNSSRRNVADLGNGNAGRSARVAGQQTQQGDTMDMSFGFCIMDEAGQIMEAAALGPLMYARQFVLVGDDYQLPPLVVSNAARAYKMDVSLFNRLAQAHPEAVELLTEQYRMNDTIMSLCNRLVYEDRMKCAKEVASARLYLPLQVAISPYDGRRRRRIAQQEQHGPHDTERWLALALSPDPAVVFLDTDSVKPLRQQGTDAFVEGAGAALSSSGDVKDADGRLFNSMEAQIVQLLIRGLVEKGAATLDEVGVISPYRAQVDYLNDMFGQQRRQLTALRDAVAPAVTAVREGRAIGGKVALGTGTLVAVERGSEMTDVRSSTAIGVIPSAQSRVERAPLSLDVSTVDKYQGRDKDIIILSMVRQAPSLSSQSSSPGKEDSPLVGDLLRDWRRINVAITRARLKLIVVGRGSTLEHVPLLAELVSTMKEQQWHVQMPDDALQMYSHVLIDGDSGSSTEAVEGIKE